MRITIAIPTIKGREASFLNCLIGVIGQSYKDWQLAICTTNDRTECRDEIPKNPLNSFLKSIEHFGNKVIVIQDKVQQGPGAAIQQIIEQVDTELVFRVDDDVVLTPRVLEKLIETYDRFFLEKARIVAAPVNGFGVAPVNYPQYWASSSHRPHLIGNGRYEKLNDNFVHHAATGKRAIAEVDFLSGYCILFNRNLVADIKYTTEGAPRHHKEDWYMTLRIKNLGYRLLIRADAIAFHHHYGLDESDHFRSKHSKEDHKRFFDFHQTLSFPSDRMIGIIDYEA